jgi:death on curing protein
MAIDFLDIHDLLEIAEALIPKLKVRDLGLLEAAVARPQTTVFGNDAYESFEYKAASLMHSIARNHPLIDGNKRLAWAATRTFCLLNGYDIYNDVDSAERIVLGVATGKLDVPEIATALEIRKGKIIDCSFLLVRSARRCI